MSSYAALACRSVFHWEPSGLFFGSFWRPWATAWAPRWGSRGGFGTFFSHYGRLPARTLGSVGRRPARIPRSVGRRPARILWSGPLRRKFPAPQNGNQNRSKSAAADSDRFLAPPILTDSRPILTDSRPIFASVNFGAQPRAKRTRGAMLAQTGCHPVLLQGLRPSGKCPRSQAPYATWRPCSPQGQGERSTPLTGR